MDFEAMWSFADFCRTLMVSFGIVLLGTYSVIDARAAEWTCNEWLVRATRYFFSADRQLQREFKIILDRALAKNSVQEWNALSRFMYTHLKAFDPALGVRLVIDSPYGQYLDFTASPDSTSELGLTINQALTQHPELKIHYVPKFVAVKDGSSFLPITQTILVPNDAILFPDKPSGRFLFLLFLAERAMEEAARKPRR